MIFSNDGEGEIGGGGIDGGEVGGGGGWLGGGLGGSDGNGGKESDEITLPIKNATFMNYLHKAIKK